MSRTGTEHLSPSHRARRLPSLTISSCHEPLPLSSSKWPRSTVLWWTAFRRTPGEHRLDNPTSEPTDLPLTCPLAIDTVSLIWPYWRSTWSSPCLLAAGHARRPNPPVRGDHVTRTDGAAPLPLLFSSTPARLSPAPLHSPLPLRNTGGTGLGTVFLEEPGRAETVAPSTIAAMAAVALRPSLSDATTYLSTLLYPS
jgi:hypothetical protein